MKLMQRILSRSLLIILILVAGIAYYYRDQLFPSQDKDRVAVSDAAGEAAAAEDRGKSAASDQTEPDGNPTMVSSGTGSTPPDVEAETPPPQPGELSSVQPPPMQPQTSDTPDEPPPAMNQPEPAPGTVPDDADTREPQTVGKPAREQSTGQTQSESGQGVSLEDARSAYWKGDKARAEQLYRTIMQANVESPEAAGELGNLLYSKGDFEAAAEAYYQAALRLQRQGAEMQARHLARIIRSLDSNKADALEEKLNR